MAAFTSNIDITSGGTYNMNITNGEPASQVATDLNGKFANIQQYLQNGLPEVWTGESLPDSLPNGKLIIKNSLYYGSDNTMHNIPLTGYLQRIYTTYTIPVTLQLNKTQTISLFPTTYAKDNICVAYIKPTLFYKIVGKQTGDSGSVYYASIYMAYNYHTTDPKGIYLSYGRNDGESINVDTSASMLDAYGIVYRDTIAPDTFNVTFKNQGIATITEQNVYLSISAELWIV